MSKQQVNERRREFVLPTKPLTIIDAINRMVLATGGTRNAQVGSGADYNGHCVSVEFNDYRGYWVASYTWGGDMRFARGDLAHCLTEAKQFYESQGRGASVRVRCLSDADEATCTAHGYMPADAEDKSWRDWKFEQINQALEMERHGFGNYTGNLIAATSPEDYAARCKAEQPTSRITALIAA
jgi:hypothetical protein